MADVTLDSRNHLRNALEGLKTLLSNERAIVFATHQGLEPLASLGRCAASLGMLASSHLSDDEIASSMQEELEKIAPSLKFLKARFLNSEEPSLFGNSSAAQRTVDQRLVKAIDSIANAGAIDITIRDCPESAKGPFHNAAHRDR